MHATPLEERTHGRKAGAVLIVLLVLSLAYSVLVMQQLLLWAVVWLAALATGLSLFVVYLLYRLVVAVETIAEDA